jgi:hypothetical protein
MLQNHIFFSITNKISDQIFVCAACHWRIPKTLNPEHP